MTSKDAPPIPQFGGYRLADGKLWLGAMGYDVAGAVATFDAEPSRRGPSAGRAVVGVFLGAVLGLALGLTQTEHAKSRVTVTWEATRSQLVLEDTTDKWEHARYMAQEINRMAA
jgi:hypothetical protein